MISRTVVQRVCLTLESAGLFIGRNEIREITRLGKGEGFMGEMVNTRGYLKLGIIRGIREGKV